MRYHCYILTFFYFVTTPSHNLATSLPQTTFLSCYRDLQWGANLYNSLGCYRDLSLGVTVLNMRSVWEPLPVREPPQLPYKVYLHLLDVDSDSSHESANDVFSSSSLSEGVYHVLFVLFSCTTFVSIRFGG